MHELFDTVPNYVDSFKLLLQKLTPYPRGENTEHFLSCSLGITSSENQKLETLFSFRHTSGMQGK